jgi:hypothetical protein
MTSFKLNIRRKYMQDFLSKYGDGSLKIMSIASSPIMGTPDSMTSQNLDLRQTLEQAYATGVRKNNPRTEGIFVPENAVSPHPRFLGLA